MKILVALSRFPYPIDKGDKLRAYYQIRDLSKNHELYVVCLNDKKVSSENYEAVSKFCKKLVVVKNLQIFNFLNLLIGLVNTLPFQVNYFRSSKMKRIIHRIIVDEKIDVCYVQLIRLIPNIPFGLNVKYYLDYMDALSKGMETRFKLSKWYEKPMVAIEAKRLREYEKKVTYSFQGFSIISTSDASIFSTKLNDKLTIVPNGVNESFLENLGKVRKDFDVIFTGNLGYYPNVQACIFIVDKILPALKSKGWDVKVCLAGVNPSAQVLSLKSETVIVTGYVPDIRDYYRCSKIFVAPLFAGSGLQNKLLEAMAIGIPVITTSLANKALNAKDGLEVKICDESSTFAEEIIRLLNDETKAAEIGLHGKSYVEKNYNWVNCNLMLEEAFNKVITERNYEE